MDSRGRTPAREFFASLSEGDQAKVLALFGRLAEQGTITNREKFKSLGAKGGNLFEFKSFQVRFVGDFRPGGRFLVAHGLRKQQDNLRPAELLTAKRVLEENDRQEKEE